jgi:uncharacterized membrane protein SirB2
MHLDMRFLVDVCATYIVPIAEPHAIRKYTYRAVVDTWHETLLWPARLSGHPMYFVLRYAHLSLAIVTLCGFLLRAYWMVTGSAYLQHRFVKVAPHVVDTAFLLSGIGLVLVLHLNPMRNPWLLAKLLALICYILLGSIALKRGHTLRIRMAALILALLSFAYIVGAAISKSPTSWLAYIG